MGEVKVRLHQMVKMRDGVKLSTDLYLPKGDGPWPFILHRTPYGNHAEPKTKRARYFASKGFGVAIQDVRGRHDSEGEWEPFFHEADDGYDTQTWLARQPYCNSRIGLMGGSYEGFCVWISSIKHHPAVKCLIASVALPDPVVNVPYQNGALFWNMVVWALHIHGRVMQDTTRVNWERLYLHLPLRDLDKQAGIESKPWQDWLDHPMLDDYWRRACYMDRLGSIDIPALHISGWYDDDGISTFYNFPFLRQKAKTRFARDNQQVIIGPWAHQPNAIPAVPGVDFGPKAVINLEGYMYRWFDRWLNNPEPEAVQGQRKSPRKVKQTRAKIFLMGENKWYDFKDWPPGSVRPTPYYLHGNGRANSLYGTGLLSIKPLGDENPKDEFTYDPGNPVPYIYDPGTLQMGGPTDQRSIERRDDVLVYSTPPLTRKVVLCGRVFARLYVSTTAVDTDFTAKLVDVYPKGLARLLCDGIIRLPFRDRLDRYKPVTPGKVYEIEIDMWATGIRFLKGHRIRVEISSSAVPKFARNLNTGEDPSSATKFVTARQTVYHTPKYPSHILLPVVASSATRRGGGKGNSNE